MLTIIFQLSKPQWTLIAAYFLVEYKPHWLFQIRRKQFHITFYELCTWISVHLLTCNKNLKHSDFLKLYFSKKKLYFSSLILAICNCNRLSNMLSTSSRKGIWYIDKKWYKKLNRFHINTKMNEYSLK